VVILTNKSYIKDGGLNIRSMG